ncbi:MAG: hypothetical protein HZA32_13620 [Opitutae bacterium]|nr:hypothetical protein [Opitutae bacterium]
MSDRLDELRRQRALLQQHLEWLDAEIAATEQSPETSLAVSGRIRPPDSHSRATPMGQGVLSPATAPVDTEIAAVLAAQKDAPKDSAQEAKRGCLAAFALMLLVLGLVIFGWYLLVRARH